MDASSSHSQQYYEKGDVIIVCSLTNRHASNNGGDAVWYLGDRGIHHQDTGEKGCGSTETKQQAT